MTKVSRQSVDRVVVRGGYFWQPNCSYFEDEPAHQRLFAEALGEDSLRRLDPFCQCALYSVEMARRACVSRGHENRDACPRHAVCVGTALGAQSTRVRYSTRLAQHGPAATNPIDFPDSIDGAAAAHIAMRWGLQGASLTFVQGRASASSALLAACRLIAAGHADNVSLAIGDVFDPWMRSSIAASASAGNTSLPPKDAVFALVLEGRDTSAVEDTDVFVTGFLGSKLADGEDDGNCLVRYVTPPIHDPTDFSGVLQIAGAWHEVLAPMCSPLTSCQDGSVNASSGSANSQSALRLAFCRKVKLR